MTTSKDTKSAPAAAPAGTAVANVTGTAVVSWKDKMAAITARAAQSEAPKGGFLSFKGGNMMYDDQMIPNNKMEVIVVDFLLENAIFREKYNPLKTTSPMCYAFGRVEEDLQPHENSEEPQAGSCAECPHNEWGSDPDGGRGKACKNSRRIAIIDADVLKAADPIEAIRKANVVMCKIPVTSIKNFSQYVNQCAKVLEQPTFGVITELSTKPHPTSLFQVHWKILDQIKNDDLLQALLAKSLATEKQLSQPYPANEEAEAKPASKKY